MSTTPKRIIWRPYTQESVAIRPIFIDRAEGAYLYTKDGRPIFDGISSWWVITHGHCHPKIVEAIRTQASRLDQVIFANFTHEPAERLSEALIRSTPEKLSRVFFSDNGSTAVESALKMALQACQQMGHHQKTKFVAFSRAYHGDTVGAMSVSGDSLFTRPYRSALFDIHRLQQPEELSEHPSQLLLDFAKLMGEHHQTIAGVIIEPLLQAAGGMIVWPKGILQEISSICIRHNVLLIFDEVMTGFGRTGSLFAMDQIGITPDLLCLSKGITGGSLPLAVTLAGEDIYQAFLSAEKSKMFFHGHSFTGNPMACAAAVASLGIFSEEQTLEKIHMIEATNRKNLVHLEQRVPIRRPRTCGVVAAFEVTDSTPGYGSKLSENLTETAFQLGLFVRPLGNTVYFLPPYCATQEDLDDSWEKLTLALKRVLP